MNDVGIIDILRCLYAYAHHLAHRMRLFFAGIFGTANLLKKIYAMEKELSAYRRVTVDRRTGHMDTKVCFFINDIVSRAGVRAREIAADKIMEEMARELYVWVYYDGTKENE